MKKIDFLSLVSCSLVLLRVVVSFRHPNSRMLWRISTSSSITTRASDFLHVAGREEQASAVLSTHTSDVEEEGQAWKNGTTAKEEASSGILHNSASSSSTVLFGTLYPLLVPIESCSVEQMSPTALAYIGDVVFELFVRCRYVWPNRRMSSLQDRVVNIVRAETQANLLAEMVLDDVVLKLTKKEKHVIIRGRNAVGGKKSGSRGTVYQDATALETFLGYTYISNPGRCKDILSWIQRRLDEMDNTTEANIL